MSAARFRLPAPAGALIDRSRPLSFRFEGVEYPAYAGDTIASALAASGVRLLSRSFKYHRPRGILSGAGHDGNCLVQIGDEPNVPADCRLITDGLEVRGQHYRGTLRRDRDAILEQFARFMTAGFYYRTFFRPRGIWQAVWEPIIRARSGLGRVDPAAGHVASEKQHLFCDVAVIGGGPAGIAAAIEAASAGADVLLVDDKRRLGGALDYARFDVEGRMAARRRDELLSELAESPVNVMSEALCTGWFADNWLPVLGQDRLYKLRAQQVVFATGSIEQPLVFRNNDLPGVMLGSAAQRLIRLYGVRPGNRAVVLSGHDDAYGVALDLAEAGIEIAALVELRDHVEDSPLTLEVRRRGLPVRTARRVDEALSGRGERGVTGCVVDGATLPCDLVCVSPGYVPAYHLPAQAGARVSYDERQGSFAVEPDGPLIRLAGSLNGAHSLAGVIADGRCAGNEAARAIGLAIDRAPSEIECDNAPSQLAQTIFPHPKGKDFIDFDEDLQVADIMATVRRGYRHIELVKRFSTVGMGPSQGRHTALNTARVVAQETGQSLGETGLTTARPPTFGEPLGLLAGRGHYPERLTAMHHRHLELGAHMMAVGAWWRPQFYGPKSAMEAAVEAEIAAAHDNVGMIDVSTLGKFEIRGPDAAELIERLYTFSFARQPVGRIRYLLMTNEAGVITDDGVAARLGDRHFYLTATTGAADNTFRQMQWWNAQWRLKVDIANVTAGFAAVNVVGPRAREVLQRIPGTIDLSPQAFPYLCIREGMLDGMPARLLRIGFVGELGYEIHVPSSYGEALWDRVCAAGAPFGLKPIGIEAQRRLRLEKGHIIVGQDTDAMTTPAAAGMSWAVARDKPPFVGSRSLELRARRPAKRQLAGFRLALDAPVPPESCLVIEAGEMVGMVTSAMRSQKCGSVIGLALIDPRLAEIGGTLTIRLPDRTDIAATIATFPFYDPQGERQKL